jgi:hypothetical protein
MDSYYSTKCSDKKLISKTQPGGGAGANKYFDCCVDGSLYSNYKRLLYDPNKNQYVNSFK